MLVQRALPTPPTVRKSVSLYLVEAERQGIKADREMLYIGPEPASEQVAATLRVEPGEDVIARRKLMFANGVPVRIATSFFRADLFADTRMAEPDFVRPRCSQPSRTWATPSAALRKASSPVDPRFFERETLDLEPDEWIIQILRTSYSTPVHALETICAASRHIFPIGQVAGTDEF